MKGTIDGADIYLDEGQLPAFTLSVNSIIDPSKIKGVSSTTIRVQNTKEAARALGREFMCVDPPVDRPTMRIGEDSVDLFRASAIPVRKDRDTIELLCVGGNASWFEQAKDTRIHDLDMGISEELDSALQIATWDDDDSALYFPLVDFGALEGRANTYNVPITALRAGLRVHKIIEAAMYQFGYRVVPIGKINRIWKKLVIYDPKAKPSISIPGPYPAYEDYYTSNPAPDGFYFIPSATGTMQVTCNQLELNFNPADAQFDAAEFSLVVYDFSARRTIATHQLPLYYSGDVDYGAALIDHVFTGVPVIAGHQYYVAIQCADIEAPYPCVLNGDSSDIEYDRDSGTQVLRLRPGNTLPNAFALMPTGDIGAYYEGYRINIAKAAPDWTVDKLLKAINSVFCLTFSTDSAAKIIKVELDAEYFRTPATGRPFRDWTERMDHTVAPAIVEPSLPKRLILKYENDEGDKYLTMAERRARAEFGYGSFVQDNNKAYGNDVTVTVPVSPTINGKLFGALSVPVMRDVDGEYQEDNIDRKERLLIADGVATGTWKLDGATQSTYPVCYFSDPSTPLPLPFGNANFNRTLDPVSSTQNWSRRLLEQRTSRILEAHLFIRDTEIKDFDFGLPTLIDDGSGPVWVWVQEIKQHRFGIHQPTKCVLVRIPTAEVDTEEVIQPAITYPTQPFLCVGPGYVSFVVSSGGTGAVNLETNSGYFTVREPNGTLITVETGTSVDGFGAGAHCVWASDSEGNKVAGPSITYFGIGVGDFDEIILDGLENEPVGNITIIEAETLTTVTIPAIAALTNLNIDVNADIEEIVITDAGALNYLLLSANALTEACVDAIAVEIASGSVSGGTLNMDGGTSSAPSATGDAAIATLEAPPNMSISGTGNANVDGDYDDDGTQNGKSRYLHASNGITEVYWTGAQWRILAVNAIFDSYDAVAQPWLATTWILVSGTGSLPTVNPPGRGWTVTTN